MSRSLYEKISLDFLLEIINKSSTFQEVLQKIGYKQTTNTEIINKLKNYCNLNNINYQHLKDFNEKRKCIQCNIEKSLNEFYPRRAICKDCVKENERKKYANRQEILNSYRKECAKCKIDKYYLIDFHHLDPSIKEYSISANPNIKIENLQKELDKCICLCANCHREFHFLERTQNITIEDYLKNNY